MAYLKDKIFGGGAKIYWLLFFLGALNLLIFYFAFGFHPNNDTDSYIFAIDFFKGLPSPIFPNRYLNPLYAVIGSKLLFFIPAAASIVVSNIVFYFGLIFLTFGLVRRVFRDKIAGLAAALLVATNYALLRYGLTQVQDLGGYFWFILTLYSAWRWRESKSIAWLYLAGVSTAFGLLTKESGAMAALFAGILILEARASWPRRAVYFVQFSFFPFITLLINQWRSHDFDYNSWQWLIDNWQVYAAGNYTLFKWFGVNASTYNLVWLFFALGLCWLVRDWKIFPADAKIYLLAVIPSSLSYFAWPLFISRTVFISAWLIIPLAAYSLSRLYASGDKAKIFAVCSLLLLFAAPYALQSILKYAHLFKIIEDCQNNLVCAWQFFWANRTGISAEL